MVEGLAALEGRLPRILLLENEPADAELVEHELRRAGIPCETRIATDRESYLATLRDWPPDLVLADDQLGGFRVADALTLLRAEVPSARLIVITGAVDEATAVECVKAGAADYLFKGRLGRLAVAVRRTLDERRCAETNRETRAQLDASRRLLQAFIDHATDAIFAKDLEGRYVLFNASAAQVAGRPAGELFGRADADFFPSDQAQAMRDADRRAIEAEAPFTFEETLTDPTGEVRTYLTTKGPLHDASGRVTGLFGIARDITERKRIENQLRTHDATLRGVIEGSNALVFSVDTNLRYTSFNRAHALAMETLYGTAIQLGEAAIDRMATADRALVEANLRRALAGQPFTEVIPAGDPARARHFLELFHGPIRGDDNGVIGAVVIGHDISDRVRTEEQIRKLSRAVEQSPVSIVITDTAGVIEYVNPKFSQVTGYSAEEVIGQNPRVLKSGHTPTEFYREMWQAISSGNEWRGEFQNRHKDGSVFWEEASISAIRDAAGTITHYVGVKEDITSRKRAEEELRQTQQQLLQAQKMESIGRLAGGIAHDFNNLLTAINGFSELALEGLPPDHPARQDIEQIRDAGDRAERLTRQLLAFSRQQVLEPCVMNLNAVISGLVGLLRRVIGEQIAFEARLADDLGRVLADPGQIEQVIVNLAVNARDAMPGGGRLTIETANVDLDRTYVGHDPGTRGGAYAMLAVTDTGSGMTEEVRRRAFEPFFTTKAAGAGSGLGLSMVYGIVRQSGGNVWVFSEPGQGTCVRIYLPSIDPPPGHVDSPATRAVAEERRVGTEWILLVEDDEAVRSLAAQWLMRDGYNVLEAPTPEEALELGARSELQIDVLLTDVVMPGLDGTKVAARLRELRPSVRVVYMSGYPDTAFGVMRDLGDGHGFLQKPFTSVALARKIRQALDRE